MDRSRPSAGDFDAELAHLDPRHVGHHEGGSDAKVVVVVGIEGEDAKRLEHLAQARGKNVADVVAELVRDADASAA